ncbi:hypothetical protein OWV82_006628 [Melia azedarach]|uniref:Uncharacterized protein n=1 Tax=Melia azedarach TaxID=155640 RepID=A0ACC1YJF2_MELAZ|nr:hypothetical protein OWV82_006628 [Melia azedarach]
MPPKKGNSSKASSSFNNKRFVSLEAQDKFNKFEEEDKALVRERALKPIPGDGRILEFIQAKKWEALTDIPTPAILSLVREFYANASLACFNTFASYFRQLQPDAQFPPLPQFPPSRRNDNDEDQ